MNIPMELIIGGALVFVAAVVALLSLTRRTREIDLDRSEGGLDKPDWVQSSVPAETISELRRDSEPFRMFDRDPAEELAAPFAEQLEDIIHVLMRENPELASIHIDLGSADDGSLEIWVDGEPYGGVDEIPDTQIREIIREAIKRWEAAT